MQSGLIRNDAKSHWCFLFLNFLVFTSHHFLIFFTFYMLFLKFLKNILIMFLIRTKSVYLISSGLCLCDIGCHFWKISCYHMSFASFQAKKSNMLPACIVFAVVYNLPKYFDLQITFKNNFKNFNLLLCNYFTSFI